jgi:hypothetical protein
VCVAAKSGAECVYKSVLYEQAESAFLENSDYIIATVPSGGTGEIDRDLHHAEAALEALDAEIERLLDAMSPLRRRPIGVIGKGNAFASTGSLLLRLKRHVAIDVQRQRRARILRQPGEFAAVVVRVLTQSSEQAIG